MSDREKALQVALGTAIWEMYLCEVDHLILHPGQLYRFFVHPACIGCMSYVSGPPAPAGEASLREALGKRFLHYAYILEGNAGYWLGLPSEDSVHHGKWLNNIAQELRQDAALATQQTKEEGES